MTLSITADAAAPRRSLAWTLGIAVLVTGYVYVVLWGRTLPGFTLAALAVGVAGGIAFGTLLGYAEVREELPAASGAWLVLLCALAFGFVLGADLEPSASLALLAAVWADALCCFVLLRGRG
ncbi:hypothetical protein [Halarchaeum sp. P4]|uniref:hypothetical protein n=1 Tax=Halarchaeum sp. P4 TaxID=3421639 RepID=UPI003EC0B187